MTAGYRFEQHYEVLQLTTAGAIVEVQRAKLFKDEPYEGLYMIVKVGDYPLRVENQLAWLAKQQPSTPVTLLLPTKKAGFYESSPDVGAVGQ